jgi:diguanylate cyclase (GGDEF)-like protein
MNTPIKILFIDDQDDEVFMERRQLERDGIDFTWTRVDCEADVRRALREFAPDVILCDYTIPGYSGAAALELVHELRPTLPFLFVSGTIPEKLAVSSIGRGVSDYVLKTNLLRLGVAVRRAMSDAQVLERERDFEARIHHLSHYDALTDLPNLEHVAGLAKQAIARARTHRRMVALATLNLDQFRRIEVGFGRSAGDEALKDVARLLKVNSRPDDSVARVGSDEFLLVLADLNDTTEAANRVQRMLDLTAQPRRVVGQELRLTASAGIAMYPGDGLDFETLMPHSGAALRLAKDTSRGTLRFHSGEVTRQAQERLRLETRLRSAIQHHELSLNFQPQFNIRSGLLCGIEALARWHPDGLPSVPPAVFIPIAERAGLISALGAWALEEACATARSLPGRDADLPIMGVNVSVQQISSDFTTTLARALASGRVCPERLELEITESVLISDTDLVLDCLAQWKRLGVRIAIDDFGAGYSSLSYLSRLPVDRLKLDASLIRNMTSVAKDAAIVRSVVALGRELGFEVLAEGVETAEQLDMLRSIGCAQAQGFLLGRPGSAPEIRALLRTNPNKAPKNRETSHEEPRVPAGF